MTNITTKLDRTDREANAEANGFSPKGMFWLGLVAVIATGFLYALPRVSLSTLRLLDVDGYMRAQRVVDLIVGDNSWFDSWVHRANAPFGHTLHWTRPVDLILVTLSWPFTFVASLKEAVFLGSLVFGVVMLVAIFLAVSWTARALVGRGASYLAGAATAFQLGLVSYNAPGHPDHHGMVMLASALLIGCTLRLLKGDSRLMAIGAGVIAGVGIWVATEFLFPLAVCLLALLWGWITRGLGLISIRNLTTSLFLTLLAAVLAERHPASWLVLEAERVSALHLLMAGLLVAAAWGWGLVGVVSVRWRLLVATLSAGAVGGLLLWIFPGFFLGPVQAIQPSVDQFLAAYVTELGPTWNGVGREWAGIALLLGAPALAIVAAVLRVRSNRGRPSFSGWALLLGWSVASFALAIASFRYVILAELLAGIPLAAVAERRLALAPEKRQSLLRPLLAVWCLLGYLVLVVAGAALAGESTVRTARGCSLEQVEAELAQSLGTFAPGEPIVLAGVPYGPELMWRLPVRVIGTPYLNPSGIEFTEAVFTNKDFEAAIRKLDDRGVDAVLICEGEAGSSGYAGKDTFYTHLLAGSVVRGWTQVDLVFDSPYRMYLRTEPSALFTGPEDGPILQ